MAESSSTSFNLTSGSSGVPVVGYLVTLGDIGPGILVHHTPKDPQERIIRGSKSNLR